jgi:chromosomal replication initiation ATPase DnaA
MTSPPAARRIILEIALEIAERHHIGLVDLFSSNRVRRFSWPRQELYARAYRATGWGRVRLGKLLGRDCGTIFHGIKAYEKRLGEMNAG